MHIVGLIYPSLIPHASFSLQKSPPVLHLAVTLRMVTATADTPTFALCHSSDMQPLMTVKRMCKVRWKTVMQ